MTEACPGCGVTLETKASTTHPYMSSSPGCWERFGMVLAEQYNPERMPFHQLTVDAYAASHPGIDGSTADDPRSIQSVAIHLMTLCLFIEHNTDPVHGPRLHRLMVERPAFIRLPAPDFSGRINVSEMTLGASLEEAHDQAWAWARDVWDAHVANHDTIRTWLRALQLIE